MLDKESVRKLAAKYAQEVKKVLDPDTIILFGSYVNGKPHEWSDIDIAVVMNDFQGNWMETVVMLFDLRKNVSFDIEPHLLDELRDKSGFLEHVKKTGEILYKMT
jgi:predicted nucleotidyltransferase